MRNRETDKVSDIRGVYFPIRPIKESYGGKVFSALTVQCGALFLKASWM